MPNGSSLTPGCAGCQVLCGMNLDMPRLTPAVMRALDIIDLFVDKAPELSAAEIGEATGLPRTTVHELLGTLVHRGFLAKDNAGIYSLGVRALQIGNAYSARFDMLGAATEVARETAITHGVTCSVAVLEESDVFYLAKVEGREVIPLASSVGKRMPAHATGLGKMLLSGLGPSQLNRLYPTGRLEALMPNTITDLADLKAELARIRERGYATESEESTPNAACAALPVFNAAGAMVAAVSITVTTTRWGTEPEEHWVGIVRTAATKLSSQLGAPAGQTEQSA